MHLENMLHLVEGEFFTMQRHLLDANTANFIKKTIFGDMVSFCLARVESAEVIHS